MTTLGMILELQHRGFVVHHKTDVLSVSWHRATPFPGGLDFKTEALQKLRELIPPEMVEFSTRRESLGVEVHSARLRLLFDSIMPQQNDDRTDEPSGATET